MFRFYRNGEWVFIKTGKLLRAYGEAKTGDKVIADIDVLVARLNFNNSTNACFRLVPVASYGFYTFSVAQPAALLTDVVAIAAANWACGNYAAVKSDGTVLRQSQCDNPIRTQRHTARGIAS